MARLIDANVILRYLLHDVEEQSQRAKEIISNGAYASTEVIAEVVYVLDKTYHVPRDQIKVALTALLKDIQVENVSVLRFAFEVFSLKRLDFVDCVLISRACIVGDLVFSFDKKLNATLRQYGIRSDR